MNTTGGKGGVKGDFHIHTYYSDGVFSPEKIVDLSLEAGLQVIALTDHDNVLSYDVATEYLKTKNVDFTVIRGIEVNTLYKDYEVHILGYFPDVTKSDFKNLLKIQQHARIKQTKEILHLLAKKEGIKIAFDDVKNMVAEGGSIGRPHIAKAITNAGGTSSVMEAYSKYIHRASPVYVERKTVTPFDAVEVIYDSGGIPVIAHPYDIDIAEKLIKDLMNCGVENIASVTHCMTRLRFVVKDEGKINDAAVKATDGVMGVVNQGGQYQIIIGNHVEEAYNEVLKMGDFGEASQVARGEKKEPLTLKKVGNNILDAIVGTMSPLIPAIIGGSMVKLLVMLLGMVGVLSADSETYKILNTIGDAAFYFLPVMVAASASKKFNTNMFIAIAIAGLMLHPDFRTMMEAVTVGDTAAHFLGIPVVGVKYTYTVIPALCMTWILSYIERAIDKITPAVTKNFLKPMLIFLIAAPIAIIVVGPVGIMIGEGISAFVYFVQAKLGFLAVGIMGALWPLLVITGMHRVFTPTILQTISETGMEGTVMPSEIGANLSLGGVSLAVAFKTKNSELRQTALAAASSALIAGTTEPALYGVAVRLKRPLIASLITGFVCGCLAGMAGLASRSMVSPSVLTGVQFIDPANPGVSIAWIAGISVLSIVLSFVLTLVIGFEDLPEEE